MGDPAERLLTVRDVMERLGCGERKAREVILSQPHVRVGRDLKIRPRALERWIDKGGDDQWRDSTFENGSGGAGDTTSPANDGASQPGSETSAPPNSRLVKSSGATRLIPRRGHGKNSRSKKRSG